MKKKKQTCILHVRVVVYTYNYAGIILFMAGTSCRGFTVLCVHATHDVPVHVHVRCCLHSSSEQCSQVSIVNKNDNILEDMTSTFIKAIHIFSTPVILE